jgi:hypothetical protein
MFRWFGDERYVAPPIGLGRGIGLMPPWFGMPWLGIGDMAGAGVG